MGIEFLKEPPKEVGDIKLDAGFDGFAANIGYRAEFGVYPMYVQIGKEDARVVFANIIYHSAPEDQIDFAAMRALLYDVVKGLSEGRRKSYKKGVDLFIEQMVELGS